jgi:hypothetical protein
MAHAKTNSLFVSCTPQKAPNPESWTQRLNFKKLTGLFLFYLDEMSEPMDLFKFVIKEVKEHG